MLKNTNYLFQDHLLTDIDFYTNMVHQENLNQLEKWGIQSHTLPEWMLYTTEEFGELSQAVSEFMYRKGNRKEIIKEGIQVITLTLKIIEMVDKMPNNQIIFYKCKAQYFSNDLDKVMCYVTKTPCIKPNTDNTKSCKNLKGFDEVVKREMFDSDGETGNQQE